MDEAISLPTSIATEHIRGKIKSMPYTMQLKRCEEETRNWHGKMSAFSSDVTIFFLIGSAAK